MSITERLLFWLGIVVLVIALVGVKANLSKLEQQVQQVSQTASEGGEE